MSVQPNQRHKRSRPCQICGGGDDDRRGHEKRCNGYLSSDGTYEYCSREELAGSIDSKDGVLYAHRLHGPCDCGIQHGEARSNPRMRTDQPVYDYRNEYGVVVFQVRRVVRDGEKAFYPYKPDGCGGWTKGLDGVAWLPYRLDELVRASGVIYITEGERDADTLARLGVVATTNPFGAGKWARVHEVAKRHLDGKDVVVVADADEKGRQHARDVQTRVRGVAKTVRVVEPPLPHKDVSDLIESGGAVTDLVPWADNEAGGIKTMGASDIFATLPPYPWLVPGMHIAPGRITLMSGLADVGKTVIAQSIALAVATRRQVWGIYTPARAGRVLHLNGEIGSYLARERYQRLARAMGIDPTTLIDSDSLRLANFPDVTLDDPDAEGRLIAACSGCVLVIIDSLRAFSGKLNEDKKEIGQALLMLARVSEATGATIIVLHHNRKPGKDDIGGAKQSISGSGSISGGSESIFVMTADKGEPILVEHERSPLGKKLDNFGLIIEDVERDGDRRWGLTVRHLELKQLQDMTDAEKQKKTEAAIAKACDAILLTLTKAGGGVRGSLKELASLSHVGEPNFSRAMARLKSDGRVRRGGTYHDPEWTAGQGST